MEWFIAPLASFAAGLVDAIVGGGGLLLIPALFTTFPHEVPATLLGTNKGAAIWGTAFSAGQYARRVPLKWPTLLPAIGLAFLGSLAGAWSVSHVDPGFLRKLLPGILFVVLLYTLRHKDFGQKSKISHPHHIETMLMAAIAVTLGFYDGFFGPGTGSFFVFLFVRVLRYDFLYASANAKFLNAATNLAAISLFASRGNIMWNFALGMGLANIMGSLVGTRLALRYGTGFIRHVFIGLVCTLIIKTGWDALG
ncbi:MAG: TSUP family transporter [Lautropia sp.]|nr:TSUP family transporter [Lautropia sp.]